MLGSEDARLDVLDLNSTCSIEAKDNSLVNLDGCLERRVKGLEVLDLSDEQLVEDLANIHSELLILLIPVIAHSLVCFVEDFSAVHNKVLSNNKSKSQRMPHFLQKRGDFFGNCDQLLLSRMASLNCIRKHLDGLSNELDGLLDLSEVIRFKQLDSSQNVIKNGLAVCDASLN